MPLVLSRVDDRLIHGQVVEGWLRVVQAARIVVASDEAAADTLQTRLMRMAVPPEVAVSVLRVDATAEVLKKGEWAEERILLLMPSLREARRLVEAGVKFESMNLGGLHEAPGRKVLTPSLALSDEDRLDISFILKNGVVLETRALPWDEKRNVQEYLSDKGPS